MIVESLLEYGEFLAKVATLVIAILIIIGAIVNASQRERSPESGRLKVKKINDRIKKMEASLRESVMDDHAHKAYLDGLKKEDKQKNKQNKKIAKQGKKQAANDTLNDLSEKSVYVLDFDGDMKASAVDKMREEITGILTIASSEDEVVVKLESPGGMVHAYGLAASQLERIRTAGIPLTICVDKVAASGGYMMACIGNKILAAPFAILGSIGVVASLPNFNRVLKKYDVDYEMLTAGEYKRTLTMLGENTEEGRLKFQKDLEDTHILFKDFVASYRPQLDIPTVATGETWYGKQALDKALVDEISTSDSYIAARASEASVFEVTYEEKRNWQDKIGVAVQSAIESTLDKFILRAKDDWTSRH